MRKQDYYQVLGLSHDAPEEEIKRAYRRLALECHPDHHPAEPGLEERFKLVSEAYSILGDAEKRLRYDLSFRRGTHYSDFSDQSGEGMFEQFLESEGFDVRKDRCIGGRRGCGRRGAEMGNSALGEDDGFTPVHEVVLTRAEAARGAQKKIVMAAGGNPKTYTFRVPAGTSSGMEFRLVLDRRRRMSVLLKIRIDEDGGEFDGRCDKERRDPVEDLQASQILKRSEMLLCSCGYTALFHMLLELAINHAKFFFLPLFQFSPKPLTVTAVLRVLHVGIHPGNAFRKLRYHLNHVIMQVLKHSSSF
jgi:curved DNA-binding protein CbpA